MADSHILPPIPSGSPERRRPASRLGLYLLAVLVTLLAWQAVRAWGGLPPFLLPGPVEVGRRLFEAAREGILLRHALVTLGEVVAGLAIGVLAGTALGYVLAKSPRAERLLSPYIVASQAIPVVAIAPLLIIWFGPGQTSKVLISALIVFFPILISTIAGLRSVPDDLRDLMRSLRASRSQTFRLLEVPAAAPFLLGGLKIGSTLAVIGAVVGEFVGADAGLGFLISLARGLYDTALVFAALIVLVALALLLYGLAAGLEHWVLVWRRPSR